MTTVAKLSPEARAAIAEPRAPVDRTLETEWVLSRARVMSAGLRLLLCEIDEIGISLKAGFITAERAAADIAAIEQVPALVASMIYAEGNAENAR